jgi:hypothetical protein
MKFQRNTLPWGYVLWYGLGLPPVIAGTYTWLGLAMMFGGRRKR